MKIKLLQLAPIDGKLAKVGTVTDVDDGTAARWIQDGIAEKATAAVTAPKAISKPKADKE